jgi:hypothetical protein
VGPNGESEGPRSFALGRCFGSLVRSSVGDGFSSSLGDAVFRGGCNEGVAFGMEKYKQ